jgi:hypothetical protein
MSDPLLPAQISISLAARLAGRPRHAFRRLHLKTGLVECAATTGGRITVSLPSLEKALGRKITPADYLAADAALAPGRNYQRNYRAARRPAGGTEVAGD